MTEVLNLSGMYDNYDLSGFGNVRLIDLKGVSGTKLYVDNEGERAIREKICHDGSSFFHLIDTGDYHYITRLYLYDIREPFDLLIFDHHDDDQEPEFEGMRSCGSWIRDALFDMEDTIASVKLIKDKAEECMIKGSFEKRRPLYVSIDKDVLSKEVCPTDWDQGDMVLSEMESIIRRETEGRRILGVDICGGPAPAVSYDRGAITLNQDVDMAIIGFF